KKELVEARNQAEHTIYTTEKTVRDFGEKLPAGDKEKIERALESLRTSKESGKTDDIRRAIEEVHRVTHEFSKTLYEDAAKNQAPPPTGAPESGPGPGQEKIVDADFRTKES
ncbi:MAG TPA: Hsp70 family protein, partial [Planctomycetota bacterium]|nr:Hsp70 family protein [Planctomycetota bacterium]